MKKAPVLLLPILSCATAALLSISSASASIITPGPGAFPPDIFIGIPGGTLLASLTLPASFTTTAGTTSFTLTTAVYRDPLNPFGAGDLDFVYQISNSANSVGPINRLTGSSFTGFQTDVGFIPTGSTLAGGLFVNGSVSPQLVDRLTAATVGFGFSAPLTLSIFPGQTSVVLAIQTDATNFAAGNFSVIDGGSFTGAAFQPAGPASRTPDSGTTAFLLGLGLIGIVLGHRLTPARNAA